MNGSLIFIIIIGTFVASIDGTKDTSENVELKERSDDINQEFNRNTEINDNFESTLAERTGEKITEDAILSNIEKLKTIPITKRSAKQRKQARKANAEQIKKAFEEMNANEFTESLKDDSSELDESFEIDSAVESRKEYNDKKVAKTEEDDQSEIEEESENKSDDTVNDTEGQALDNDDIERDGDKLRSANYEATSNLDDLDDLDDLPLTRRMLSFPDFKVLETKPIADEEFRDKSSQLEEIIIPPQIGLNTLAGKKCCKNSGITPLNLRELLYPPIGNPLRIFPNIEPGVPRFLYPNIVQPKVQYFDHFIPEIKTRSNNYNSFTYPNYYQPPNQILPEVPQYKKQNIEIPNGYPIEIVSSTPPRYNLQDRDVMMKLQRATEETDQKYSPVDFVNNFRHNPVETYTPQQIFNPKYKHFF